MVGTCNLHLLSVWMHHDDHASHVPLSLPRAITQVFTSNAEKFVLVHCSSAHKGALREVLASPVSGVALSLITDWAEGHLVH